MRPPESFDQPADYRFPFRPDGNGGALQFSWRRFKWEPLVGTVCPPGYATVNWTPRDQDQRPMPRKFSKVHRIVWEVHNGPIPDQFEIDHIDGCKTNNHISNLRLVTHAENLRLARERLGNWSKRKLKPHQVALTLQMPSDANWRFWADRWGVHKVTLLTMRCEAKKKRV